MGERLIKPYEISVWEDKLIPIDGSDPVEYKFVENKLAVIGSDTMTGLNKVYNPVFNKKTNGEKTLTFSLKYKYFDPYSGNDDVINPFAALLTNERKVKLHYDNQWYEFIVKEHGETSEVYEWTYTCDDAFVIELSKNGYNITFDQELNNNQGTARELVKETIKDTDWKLGDIDPGRQLIAEPLYKGTIQNSFLAVNTDTGEEESCSGEVYVFYSYIKNKDGKNVQFIKQASNYTIDDKNVITATNYRILRDNIVVTDDAIKAGETVLIALGEIETKYQANRLSYNQLTTYDPVTKRTVDRFKIEDTEQEIYRYIDYIYTTSNVLTNYITNGENFNVLEDGTLQGWNPYVDFTQSQEDNKIDKLELVTKPELGAGLKLADLSTLSQTEGFLKIKFKHSFTEDCKNAVFNSGIENNASFLQSVSQGERFVFRWRAGQRNPNESDSTKKDVDCLVPTAKLRLLVAKYTQDTPNRWSYYYKHIDKDNIILKFDGTPQILNNAIKNGVLIENEEGKWDYAIDGVVQVPSTKYVYIVFNYEITSDIEINESKVYYRIITGDGSNRNPYIYEKVLEPKVEDISNYYECTGETEYIWNGIEGTFQEKTNDNYLPYYYLVGKAEKAIPNTSLTDPTEKYGIFIYSVDDTIDNTKPIYIQDIQLLRFVPDAADSTGETPVLIGNIPTATTNSTEYYYLKPEDGTVAEDIIMYSSLKELANTLDIQEKSIVALYNEGSEKNLSISAKQSNCFNILQTIAETFECWVELDVKHDPDTGYILYHHDGSLEKYINLREYAGKDNYAGFKYGINLQSIERSIDSTEIVTKLIVDQSQSEYVDSGFVSIASAPSNISGESYILNFDYYYSQNLLNKDEVETDRLNFAKKIADLNSELQKKETERRGLEASLTALGSKRNVYTELVTTAEDNKSKALGDFENLTNRTYQEYQILQEDAKEYKNEFYIPTEDETVIANKSYYYYDDENEIIEPILNPDTSLNPSEQNPEWYELLPDLSEEETIVDIIGTIYVSSATINNYSGFLTNIEQEYWNVRRQLRGFETYNVKIWTGVDDLEQRHIYVELNDYLPGFNFIINGSTYYSTVSIKYFDIISDATTITFDVPNNYVIETPEYEIVDGTTATLTISPIEESKGIEADIKQLQEGKDELIKVFNNKYSRFIQEGTWNSTDYIDSELYYLDALQVSNTSAQPVVSYTINVVEISQLEGFEWYLFDAGDKTYVEDTEFFGWSQTNVGTEQEPAYVLTPAREEVIVSEVEWHLEEPDKNTITVQNYKTRFEDLFQRISATVQTVQYNEATYAKISTLLDADGTINQNVLVDSFNNASGKHYALTSDGSVIINGDEILIRNLTNSSNYVKINSEGIRVSSDGSNWVTAIDGQGINLGSVYTGSLNTNEVIIGNRNQPSFRWDKSGISAFKSNGEDAYDLQTYVRYDQYGLYGIKNNDTFKAQNLQDVIDKAHFAVTWDGFFIKNSYEGGGKVEITSDNDFRVLKSGGLEKIKIGALEWNDANGDTTINPALGVGAPTLYGIRIKNDSGETVMKTGDNGNLEITGTIYANAGEIGGMIVDDDKLTMDTIVLEPGVGIYSTEKINNQPAFIISDINGGATFRNINALGGTLGQLTVQDIITVGDATHSGTIQSYGYTAGSNGWAIKSNGTAEFQNAIVRGEVNAGSGDFYGAVTVGKDDSDITKPYIVIDGQNSLIKSSNYQDGAGRGWMINKDGDATFNNITARGAIKTAVFEYAEIQAVGGVFIFRPSSTIRSATISGSNLVLTVEKPQLFKDGQWCKVSNYTADGEAENPDITSILLNNGLTHVYEVSRTSGSNNITLLGAAAMVEGQDAVINSVSDLIGGALVDMGNKEEDPITHKVGTSNYGIGINSSDNTVNLPARAISLFETVIDETQEPKITYNYRGILGTLPTMSSDKISPIYSAYMEGKQGIYTDNMYIGDKDQYIAFYKDSNGDSQLRLVAKSFEILPDDSDLPIDLGDSIVDQKVQYTLSLSRDTNTLEEDWSDVPYEVTTGYYQWQRTYIKYAKGRIDYLPSENGYYTSNEAGQPGPQGPPGPSGEDAINLVIDSSNGNTFKNNSVSTVLTVTIFKGATIIDNILQLKEVFGNTAYLQWYWKRMGDNTFSPLSVDDSMLSNGGFTLTLTPDKVDIKVVFQCEIKTVDN